MSAGLKETFTSKTFRYTTVGMIALIACPFIGLCLFILALVATGMLGAFLEVLKMHP